MSISRQSIVLVLTTEQEPNNYNLHRALNLQDWTMTDDMARVDNAGLDNDG